MSQSQRQQHQRISLAERDANANAPVARGHVAPRATPTRLHHGVSPHVKVEPRGGGRANDVVVSSPMRPRHRENSTTPQTGSALSTAPMWHGSDAGARIERIRAARAHVEGWYQNIKWRFPGRPDVAAQVKSLVLSYSTPAQQLMPTMVQLLRRAPDLVADFGSVAIAHDHVCWFLRHRSNPHHRQTPGSQSTAFTDPDQDAENSHNADGSSNELVEAASRMKQQEVIRALTNLPEVNIEPADRLQTPAAMTCELMPHQKLCLTWLVRQEESESRGGLLADTMGLGKTVQALSLILQRPSDNPRCKTTLIVAPVSLLNQWRQEIFDKIHKRHALKTLMYHGSGKNRMTAEKLMTFDIVLTSYGTVRSERKGLGAGKRHVLFSQTANFYRVILDEAHNIKNRASGASQAVHALSAKYRLCMTGTPFMNRTAEIFALVRFLKIEPLNDWTVFNDLIEKPLRDWDGDHRAEGMRALQALFRRIMLRRTKASILDGQPILKLPAIHRRTVNVIFDKEQQDFYKALETKQRLKFNKYLKKGLTGKSYTYILVLLLRLRQACDHPHLIRDLGIPDGAILDGDGMTNLAAEFDDAISGRILKMDKFRCPMCEEAAENPLLIYPCGHPICGGCFSTLSEAKRLSGGGHRPPAVEGEDKDHVVGDCPYNGCECAIHAAKVVCHNFFVLANSPDNKDEDSDDEDSSDSEADTDSVGSLGGFVVDDDLVHSDFFGDDEAVHNKVIHEEVIDEGSGLSAGEKTENPSLNNTASTQTSDSNSDDPDSDDSEIPSIEKILSLPKPQTRHVVSPGRFSASTAEGKSKRKREHSDEEAKPQKLAKMEGDDKGKGKAPAVPSAHGVRKDNGKGKQRKATTFAQLKRQSSRNATAKARYLKRLRQEYVSSAKIDKTMELLKKIPAHEKILVFSLWTSFLDLLEIPISDAGIRYARYDGSMHRDDRDAAVQAFMGSGGPRVLLLSLTAGNTGLNLTEARHVILMEPFWNPFVEDQAIDRAHRIGQKMEVQVHRMLIAGTVEDRIQKLQEEKRELVNTALSEEGAQGVSRLSVRELRGLFGC